MTYRWLILIANALVVHLAGTMLYVALGTVKEVSIGPTSLMALLTLHTCRDLPVDFVVLLTFLAGCLVLLMGLLRLGERVTATCSYLSLRPCVLGLRASVLGCVRVRKHKSQRAISVRYLSLLILLC